MFDSAMGTFPGVRESLEDRGHRPLLAEGTDWRQPFLPNPADWWVNATLGLRDGVYVGRMVLHSGLRHLVQPRHH